jgi:hypothetical protein
MEVEKCVLTDSLVALSRQLVIQKYTVAIILFSCVHFGLDWDEQKLAIYWRISISSSFHIFMLLFILVYCHWQSPAQVLNDLAT